MITYGDVDLVVGENECGVDAGQLGGVAHLDWVWDGRASRRFRTLAQNLRTSTAVNENRKKEGKTNEGLL